jgi:hypothetical protein
VLGGGLSDPNTIARLQFSWLVRSVKGSLGILRRHRVAGIDKNDRSVYNSIGAVTTRP